MRPQPLKEYEMNKTQIAYATKAVALVALLGGILYSKKLEKDFVEALNEGRAKVDEPLDIVIVDHTPTL